jgi:hypothetical protein
VATGGRVQSTISRTTGGASGVSGAPSNFGDGVSLAYDAATGSYTVSDSTGATTTFLASTRNPTASNATISVYEKASGATSDQLVLFNPGAANPRMALTYVSYGAWQRLTDNGASLNVAQQFFVYGIRQAANQPSTGSGSYSTIVDGIWANADGIYSLAGTSSFTADFSALTVATTLNLTGRNVVTAANKSLGLFNGTGTIAALGGTFNGSFAHQTTDQDGNTYTGSFAGAFFGPQGQEMGYSFSLTSPNGAAAAGAVVGKGN